MVIPKGYLWTARRQMPLLVRRVSRGKAGGSFSAAADFSAASRAVAMLLRRPERTVGRPRVPLSGLLPPRCMPGD